MTGLDAHDAISQLKDAGRHISRLWRAQECARLGAAPAAFDGTTALDRNAHDVLFDCLTAFTPEVPVLSEEAPVPDGISGAETFWLVDPIDGSHNAALGFPFFTASVALMKGGQPIFGWVHDPCRGVTYHASRGGGAWVDYDGERSRRLAQPGQDVPLHRATVGIIGGRREHAALARIAAAVGKLRVVSCSSLELCFVASGVLDAFIDVSQGGYEKDCDIAGAAVILEEANCLLRQRGGSALTFGMAGSACVTSRRPVSAASSLNLLIELDVVFRNGSRSQ